MQRVTLLDLLRGMPESLPIAGVAIVPAGGPLDLLREILPPWVWAGLSAGLFLLIGAIILWQILARRKPRA
jgi:hypothetical protein